MIASLNIVAKTFAKIAKIVARLSATILATTRRLVLILYLGAQYAKTDCKNEIYAKKMGKEHLNCKKVNSAKKSTVILGQSQQMTSTS